MKQITIGIVDYGFGNISSLYGCLKSLGFSVNVSSKKTTLKKSNLLFLPGVGTFNAGMEALNKRDLTDFIKNYSNSGRAVVGICLGMQLLFSSSKEGLPIKGLSLLPGRIEKIKTLPTHIGWNSIHRIKSRSLFNEFDNKHFYFNHTYAFKGSKKLVSANSIVSLENEIISSIVKKKNIIGMQFHPEKSQSNGAKLLYKIIMNNHHA